MKKSDLLKKIDELSSQINRQNAKVTKVLSQNEQLIKLNEKLLLMMEEMAYESETVQEPKPINHQETSININQQDFKSLLLDINKLGNYELN